MHTPQLFALKKNWKVRELWNGTKMNPQVKVQGVINLHKPKKQVISVSGSQSDTINMHFLSQNFWNFKDLNSQSGKTFKILWDCVWILGHSLGQFLFFCFNLGHKPKARVGTIYNNNIFNLDTIHLKEIILFFHESMYLKSL